MPSIIAQGRQFPVSEKFFGLSPEEQSTIVRKITEQLAGVTDDREPDVNRSAKADREFSFEEYAQDAAKSLGVALTKKGIEILGTPGDTREAVTRAAGELAEKLGGAPENAKWLSEKFEEEMTKRFPKLKGMTSTEITDIIRRGTMPAPTASNEQPQSFIDRKPRTDLGKNLKDFGESFLTPLDPFWSPRGIIKPPEAVPLQFPQRDRKQDLIRALHKVRRRSATYPGPK